MSLEIERMTCCFFLNKPSISKTSSDYKKPHEIPEKHSQNLYFQTLWESHNSLQLFLNSNLGVKWRDRNCKNFYNTEQEVVFSIASSTSVFAQSKDKTTNLSSSLCAALVVGLHTSVELFLTDRIIVGGKAQLRYLFNSDVHRLKPMLSSGLRYQF